MNKLKLIRLYYPGQQVKLIPRSLEQYRNIQLEDVSVGDYSDKRTFQVFHICYVVFNMIDCNQKLLDFLFLLLL